jgi:hypothetical protein
VADHSPYNVETMNEYLRSPYMPSWFSRGYLQGKGKGSSLQVGQRLGLLIEAPVGACR